MQSFLGPNTEKKKEKRRLPPNRIMCSRLLIRLINTYNSTFLIDESTYILAV